MKKFDVASGNGVAIGQTVACKINRMLEKRHLTKARVEDVNLRSLETELKGAIAYVEISRNNREYCVPKIDGLVFCQGIIKKYNLKS